MCSTIHGGNGFGLKRFAQVRSTSCRPWPKQVHCTNSEVAFGPDLQPASCSLAVELVAFPWVKTGQKHQGWWFQWFPSLVNSNNYGIYGLIQMFMTNLSDRNIELVDGCWWDLTNITGGTTARMKPFKLATRRKMPISKCFHSVFWQCPQISWFPFETMMIYH